ncbi:TPA: hypothetical protein N0F65_007857 [Lagenidium giganteum]|uniref:Reverse transcriptase n=1 Tax=Lagenidium giganteum TaxID=4803 RepID=A0AAV2YJI8_9STRA|nr:TPA: hypothetical protein N0F65_007857 [Lagenidium giganteum]
MDTSVLDEKAIAVFKARFDDARRGFAILKNPSDWYFDLVKRFSKPFVSADPPKGLPPERGVRHEIDQSDFIDAFFEEKRRNGLVRESKSPHSAPTFCVRKPNGKWRIVHAYNKFYAATIRGCKSNSPPLRRSSRACLKRRFSRCRSTRSRSPSCATRPTLRLDVHCCRRTRPVTSAHDATAAGHLAR